MTDDTKEIESGNDHDGRCGCIGDGQEQRSQEQTYGKADGHHKGRKACWWLVQIVVSIGTAILTALGASACNGI